MWRKYRNLFLQKLFSRATLIFSFYIIAEHMSDERRHCHNCGSELHGQFCSACGQKDKELHRPIAELTSELIDTIPAFDDRLLRTMKLFLRKPGQLAAEYLAGKRKQYLSPFKMYFFISFLFFFSGSVYESAVKKELRKELLHADSLSTVINGDSSALSIRNTDSGVSFTVNDTVQIQKLFGREFIEGFRSGKNNPTQFFDKVKDHLPKIIFLLLPIFAVLLKIVYVRSGILFISHLVFSFTFHSFIFFILLADSIIEWVFPKGVHLYANIILLTIPVYLYAGLRNMYAQSRWKTFVKVLLLTTAHGIIFILAVSAMVIAIIMFFFT